MPNTRQTGKTAGDRRHPAHGADNPAPEAGMSRDVINVGQHIFKRALHLYKEDGRAGEDELRLLEWLWAYTFDELNGSRTALAKALGYDWTVCYKVLAGTYEAGLDRFCEAVAHLRRRAQAGGTRLVATPVTERIFEALDYARDSAVMILICGPTGRSKTFASKAWVFENNHGRGKYVRIPSGCTRRTLVRHLCRSCGIGVNGKKTSDLEDRLYKAFDFRNTIVFDEAGHLLPRNGVGTSAIEYIRDLHDICGCGIALVITDVYWDELRHGRLSAYFEQFIGRIKYEVRIPAHVLHDECRAACAAVVQDPPADLIKEAVTVANNQDGKLRTLFEDLRRAALYAQTKQRPVTAADLRRARRWREQGGTWPEK